jgi:hypothetical protein
MSDLSKLVKPLVWRQVEPHIYAAETSAHAYVIFDLDAGPILLRDSLQVASGAMPDLKTAAQADYAAPIIAALDPEAVARWRDEAVHAEREAISASIEEMIQKGKRKLTPAHWLMTKADQDVLAMLASIVAAIRARKGGMEPKACNNLTSTQQRITR